MLTKKQLEIKLKFKVNLFVNLVVQGQYGDVWFEMEPLEPGKGIEFESKIVGGAVPKEYIKPIEQGSERSC